MPNRASSSSSIDSAIEVRIEDILHWLKPRRVDVRGVQFPLGEITIFAELHLTDPVQPRLKLSIQVGDQPFTPEQWVRLRIDRPTFGGFSATMFCPHPLLSEITAPCDRPVRHLYLRPDDAPPQFGCEHCLKLKRPRLSRADRLKAQEKRELQAFWESAPPQQHWLSKEEIQTENEPWIEIDRQMRQWDRDQRTERYMRELERVKARMAQRPILASKPRGELRK